MKWGGSEKNSCESRIDFCAASSWLDVRERVDVDEQRDRVALAEAPSGRGGGRRAVGRRLRDGRLPGTEGDQEATGVRLAHHDVTPIDGLVVDVVEDVAAGVGGERQDAADRVLGDQLQRAMAAGDRSIEAVGEVEGAVGCSRCGAELAAEEVARQPERDPESREALALPVGPDLVAREPSGNASAHDEDGVVVGGLNLTK